MASRKETTDPVIVWFRKDLRLHDHPALCAAAASGPIVPLVLLDDEDAGDWATGGAGRWWLHKSLEALGAALKAKGAALVLRRGKAAEVLPALMKEAGAVAVHAGRAHEGWARRQEEAVSRALPQGALVLHRTRTMFDAGEVRTKTGGLYGIYSPYARAAQAVLAARGGPAVLPEPERLEGVDGIAGDALADWDLLPVKVEWAAAFASLWTPGEAQALSRVGRFVKTALADYHEGRDDPAADRSSRLSPHLHWGEISPGTVWQAIEGREGIGAERFRSELLWREFSADILRQRPDLPDEPMRPAMAAMPHRAVPKELRAWQRGRTGVPIVDAGMRQLWQVGWMHNRLRMITASFLVKHLLVRWQEGERWFWDTLVDADLANNGVNWQWVAGTGIDNTPFFRVFNPVTQGEKFDPAGAYVRKWVPELRHLPDRYVHEPWTAPAQALGGLRLGTDYPRPIVELAFGRKRALEALKSVRSAAAEEPVE